ncbi:MAG: SDR family oxidoreductase [Micromonosporaceae bacterium]|nr:SDR family oxidoreductase [Micromonosporaceae bacterium]
MTDALPTPEQTRVDPFPDGTQWMVGRTAIVTGGGSSGEVAGVGYAISRLFARHGARVAVVDRDAAAAGVTVDEIRDAGGEAFPVIADVTRDEECAGVVKRTLERYGAVDALVNNVASGDRAGVLEVTPEHWEQLLSMNLTTAWLMTRHATQAMGPGGALVYVSSVAVSRGGPGTVYGVAKAGVENLTRGTATTLGPQGIRANCVQLGEVWTSFAARGLTQQWRARRARGVALGKEGNAWDAAYAALFLASDRARWISGQVLTVDGGGPYYGPPRG